MFSSEKVKPQISFARNNVWRSEVRKFGEYSTIFPHLDIIVQRGRDRIPPLLPCYVEVESIMILPYYLLFMLPHTQNQGKYTEHVSSCRIWQILYRPEYIYCILE